MDQKTLDALEVSRGEACALVNKKAKTKLPYALLKENDDIFWQHINRVFRVDSSFPELVKEFRTPLFDKASSLCFAAHHGHEFASCMLGGVYFPDNPGEWTSLLNKGTKWLRQGGGWWISTMNVHEIITHENYKMTDFDAPVFEQFGKSGILRMTC